MQLLHVTLLFPLLYRANLYTEYVVCMHAGFPLTHSERFRLVHIKRSGKRLAQCVTDERLGCVLLHEYWVPCIAACLQSRTLRPVVCRFFCPLTGTLLRPLKFLQAKFSAIKGSDLEV